MARSTDFWDFCGDDSAIGWGSSPKVSCETQIPRRNAASGKVRFIIRLPWNVGSDLAGLQVGKADFGALADEIELDILGLLDNFGKPVSEAAERLFKGTCDFVAGAANFDAIPPPRLPEFAVAGRSNVGKSSLINALTHRRSLARVSQNPGATKQINFFELGETLILADLPGYGYARISKSLAQEWQHLIFSYLRGRPNLRRVRG